MLAPKLRMMEMTSIVYLGDDLRSALLWCQRLSSAVKSSVYVPVDTCQSVYVNVQNVFLNFFVCLFVYLSFAAKPGSVELSPTDICSSLSCEELHSVHPGLGPANCFPNIIQPKSLPDRGECVSELLLSLL